MIARIWRGVVRTEDADTYAEYIRETGFNEYAATPGNRGAQMLRRDEDGRTEFITFSLWDSREAIKGFAGEDIEKGVFYPEDDRYLIEREDTVKHYEVVHSVEPAGGG
jgi:heme-degrading monooxygenase HmoA